MSNDFVGQLARKHHIYGLMHGDAASTCVVCERTASAIREALERVRMLYSDVNPACVHERLNGDPGGGAMAAVIEFRDAIAALREGEIK